MGPLIIIPIYQPEWIVAAKSVPLEDPTCLCITQGIDSSGHLVMLHFSCGGAVKEMNTCCTDSTE